MILQILSLIVPVFGIIAVGFLAARTGYVSEGMGRAATELGFKVVMPPLLFLAMLQVGDAPVSPLWLVGAYGATTTLIWLAATSIAAGVLRRPAMEWPAYAMASSFSNGVMLGFPIIVSALGPDAATPIAFLATVETLGLWLIGTLHMEATRRGMAGISLRSAAGVVVEVVLNPLILAMLLGLTLRYAGFVLPAVPRRLIEIVGQAGVPVSLLGLGMSLAAYRIGGQATSISAILMMKIIVAPILAFIVTTEVFGLPSLWAAALTLYVAMPVGNNAFLFAARYDQAVAQVSASVAISTLLGVVTLSMVIAALKVQGLVSPL